MKKYIASYFALFLTFNSAADANTGTATIKVKSGKATAIWFVFNCNHADFEIWPHGQKYGTVKTERYTAERCYKKDVAHIRVIYQSTPGFRGNDEIWIQSSGGSRQQIRLIVE